MVLLVNGTLLRCTRVEPCCQTYTIDKQVPDSAGTATAFLTGVKTRDGTIGVNRHAQRSNCSSEAGNAVTSILDWSKAEGASKQSAHILVVCTCNLGFQICEQILYQNVLIVYDGWDSSCWPFTVRPRSVIIQIDLGNIPHRDGVYVHVVQT